jgi:hypothetical protein
MVREAGRPRNNADDFGCYGVEVRGSFFQLGSANGTDDVGLS